MASRRRRGIAVRPLRLALVVMIVGGGIAAYLLLSGADSPAPSLRIVSPSPNATIPSGKTEVSVDVQNVQLGSETGTSKGYHLHYYLDATVPTTKGRPAIPTTGSYASTTKTSHEWTISNMGLHILAVQIVTGDDKPLSPPVVQAITVQVPKPPAPTSTPPSKSTTKPAPAGGGC